MNIKKFKYRYYKFEKFSSIKESLINNFNSSYGFSSNVSFFVDSNVYFLLGQRHIKNKSFRGSSLDQFSALRFFCDFVIEKSGRFKILVPGILFYEYIGSKESLTKKEYKNAKQKIKKALGKISSSIKFTNDINDFEICKESLKKIHKDKHTLHKVLKKCEEATISYKVSDYDSNIPFAIGNQIADSILTGESFSYIDIGFLHYAISIKAEYLVYKENDMNIARGSIGRYAIGELLELGRKKKNKDKVLGIADLFLFGECNARTQGATTGEGEYYNVLSFEKKIFKSLSDHSNTIESVSFQAGDHNVVARGIEFQERQSGIDSVYEEKGDLVKEFWKLSSQVFQSEWKIIEKSYEKNKL